MEVLIQAKLDLRKTLNLANEELQNLVSSEKLDKIRPLLRKHSGFPEWAELTYTLDLIKEEVTVIFQNQYPLMK